MSQEQSGMERFITRWKASGGAERANYASFLNELCDLLEVPRPDPTQPDDTNNAYVYERSITFHHGDGSTSAGFIDLYKRGCFVLEAKQGTEAAQGEKLSSTEQNKKLKQGTAKRGTKGWDNAMMRARGQAEQYSRALPADEGRPPLLLVVDVGHSIELYSEFTRSGGNYVPFPDPRSHRIQLNELINPEVQQRLRLAWTEPMALDPSRQTARVTREIAQRLAKLARSLELSGHSADTSAGFFMRCLFTMFAEDVGLLPKRSFTELLNSLKAEPDHFVPMVEELWEKMNSGGFSASLRSKILRFNGGLFAESEVLPLNGDQIQLLIEAAETDWRHVEPAIFGTLLERALDPVERHKLGAHYTPRAYVERLVMPTVIEPLRDEWEASQAAAYTLDREEKHDQAVAIIKAYHHRLTHVRVLDPACGTGNFLYVTLEHLKRLEGEVLNLLEEMGETQSSFEMAGSSVDPHQLLGLEVNPRAAAIADAVLWIGYLQWHYRTHGNIHPAEPVLKDFHNIENRDALLQWQSVEPMLDEEGNPVTRWDGRSTKPHPVTGEEVPDESARVEVMRYIGAEKAEWPEADFIVGNPPFVGEKRMRDALGDGYVEALRGTYNELPACDLVMYWWDIAANALLSTSTQQFGFITTNSLTQTKNRKVIEPHLKNGVSIAFAISDHPWIDSTDGAAVRIAMSAASKIKEHGDLYTIIDELDNGADEHSVKLIRTRGEIFANLSIGANITSAHHLIANSKMVYQGVKLVGDGFIVTPEQREIWCNENTKWGRYLPHLVAGTDVTKRRPSRYCIDFFGLSQNEAMLEFPPGFQKIIDDVKPYRETNNSKSFREKWWLFGAARPAMRKALNNLKSYVATSEVSKHRFFISIQDDGTIADGSLAVVASDNPLLLGVLSSRLHIAWAMGQGGRMGMGNDTRWQNGPCFENYPFPETDDAQKIKITNLATQLNTHRKNQQAQHPTLTLTNIYNVLEKLRSEEPLTAKEKIIHEQGLVAVLKEIHDDLDRAVFAAYGWDDLAAVLVGRPGATTPLPDKPAEQAQAEEELLKRLVELNHQRAAEERNGLVRWLRPEYQNPEGKSGEQVAAEVEQQQEKEQAPGKQPWPKELPAQVQALRAQLEQAEQPLDATTLARRFTRAQTKRVEELLQTLVALGQARLLENGIFTAK